MNLITGMLIIGWYTLRKYKMIFKKNILSDYTKGFLMRCSLRSRNSLDVGDSLSARLNPLTLDVLQHRKDFRNRFSTFRVCPALRLY